MDNRPMPISEIAVWSAMLGGLMTLLALALVDTLSTRTRGSVRNLVFVLITGASCLLMTGLPEVLFPNLPERLLMVLKASLGPFAGAIALYFLGKWFGSMWEGALAHRFTAWGGSAVLLAATLMAIAASQIDPAHFTSLLWITAGVTMVPVLLAGLAVWHAAQLGDPLARWMGLAMACLALVVCGMYLRGLNVPGFGLLTWVFTAMLTVIFLLMASVLVMLRNRENRQVARTSHPDLNADPATGLATGSGLLSQVDHVFWRTARRQGECTVICLYLSNLYEMAEPSGHGAEQQILVAMAARIRRAAGFRCVVGLYHPRCFVVVLPTDPYNAPAEETVERLQSMATQPVPVLDEADAYRAFAPCVGLGVVTVNPVGAASMDVINAAERQAMARLRTPASSEQDLATEPMELRSR
jgi:GGDEF domain-containing protein